MRALLPAIAILLLGAHVAIASEEESQQCASDDMPGVVDLTPENFARHANGESPVLALFYAPWCGHCKRMAPEYRALAELIQANSAMSHIIIAKVNCEAHADLCKTFDVKSFPTVLFFPQGQEPSVENAETYDQPRLKGNMFAYLISKTVIKPGSKPVFKVDAMDKIAKAFVNASDKAALIKQANDVLESVHGIAKVNVAKYIKHMDRTVQTGGSTAYMVGEKARLERLLLTTGDRGDYSIDMQRDVGILNELLGVDA